MSSAPDPRRKTTIADFFALPEQERFHELIDGELIEKGAATGEHGRTQASVTGSLRGPFDRRPGERAVYCSADPNLALGMVGQAAGENPLYLPQKVWEAQSFADGDWARPAYQRLRSPRRRRRCQLRENQTRAD